MRGACALVSDSVCRGSSPAHHKQCTLEGACLTKQRGAIATDGLVAFPFTAGSNHAMGAGVAHLARKDLLSATEHPTLAHRPCRFAEAGSAATTFFFASWQQVAERPLTAKQVLAAVFGAMSWSSPPGFQRTWKIHGTTALAVGTLM